MVFSLPNRVLRLFSHRRKRALFLAFAFSLFFAFSAFSLFRRLKPQKKEEKQSVCPLCLFRPTSPVTSSARDVVLASALSEFKRVEFFLRTLRTTGTKARVILFIDSKEVVTSDWLRLFSSCNIEAVFVNETNEIIRSSPKLSRYYFELEWLSSHIGEVDRVLHTDTFDVIFQSDPFLSSVDSHHLYFTFEPVSLGQSRWTESWVEQCYGQQFVEEHREKAVSCSGVTIGGSQSYYKYLQILLGTPKWKTCFGHSLDQAHHNALYYTNEFSSQGISIEKYGCDSPFLTMHFCCKKYHCFVDEEGYMHGNGTNIPVLIHQYNRWRNLTKRNEIICPKYQIKSTSETSKVSYLPQINTDFPKSTFTPPS